MPSSLPASVRPSLPPNDYPWFSIRRTSIRFGLSALAGVVTFFLVNRVSSDIAVVAAWDATALVLLSAAWHVMARSTPDQTRRRAGNEDPGRNLIWVLVLVTSTVSLFSAAVVLRQARDLPAQDKLIWIALSLAAVVSSWLVTHTSWTLRYAHLYYRDAGQGVGGLTFPTDPDCDDPAQVQPDDFDFAYFAFTVGMCFQVSDVTITDKQIRRAALMHSCQSFAYNTVIMALALNLAFSFLG